MKRTIAATNVKTWLFALSFTTLLLLVPATAVDESEAGANKYFRRALSTVRTHFNIPALGGVLVIDGKVVVAGATGVRKQGNATPVTDDDRFPIGSITKTFTGFVVSRLVQQNTVTWETSIQDVFPNIGSEQGIQPAYPPKMLAELMTHQADFPRDGDEGTICDTSNFTDYRCASVRASCSRRADWSGFFDRLSERTLTATSRPSLMSRARYTSPMPPAPRSASTSSEPSRWPGLSAMF